MQHLGGLATNVKKKTRILMGGEAEMKRFWATVYIHFPALLQKKQTA
jgi:hypothetical protein